MNASFIFLIDTTNSIRLFHKFQFVLVLKDNAFILKIQEYQSMLIMSSLSLRHNFRSNLNI